MISGEVLCDVQKGAKKVGADEEAIPLTPVGFLEVRVTSEEGRDGTMQRERKIISECRGLSLASESGVGSSWRR